MKPVEMTPIDLVDRLIEEIKVIVKDFHLDTNVPGVKKAPQVISGYLGEKKPGAKQDPPDFPFVIVRYLEDNDDGQQHTANIRILVGTYSEDAQNGWRDTLQVATRIKNELLKKRFIGPFSIEYPVKMEIYEEQPCPEWAASVTFSVSMPKVQEEGVLTSGL